MCELEWAHGVGAAARRSSAGLAIQRCSSRQRLPPLLSCSGLVKAIHRHALGARIHTSSRCWTHGGCLWPPAAPVRRHAGGGLPQTNYCQASARRDIHRSTSLYIPLHRWRSVPAAGMLVELLQLYSAPERSTLYTLQLYIALYTLHPLHPPQCRSDQVAARVRRDSLKRPDGWMGSPPRRKDASVKPI